MSDPYGQAEDEESRKKTHFSYHTDYQLLKMRERFGELVAEYGLQNDAKIKEAIDAMNDLRIVDGKSRESLEDKLLKTYGLLYHAGVKPTELEEEGKGKERDRFIEKGGRLSASRILRWGKGKERARASLRADNGWSCRRNRSINSGRLPVLSRSFINFLFLGSHLFYCIM